MAGIKYKGSAYKDIDPELLKEYRRLADRADKRMLRLERLAESDKEFDKVLDYSYKKASENARLWGSTSAKPRFAINPPTSEQDIKLKIKDIESFLEKPTSTKSGIIRSYKKRADNLNKLLPEGSKKLTWQDYKKYFEQAEAQNIDSKFGYRTLTKAFSIKAKYDKNEAKDKELAEKIRQAKEGKRVKLTDDKVVNEALFRLYQA